MSGLDVVSTRWRSLLDALDTVRSSPRRVALLAASTFVLVVAGVLALRPDTASSPAGSAPATVVAEGRDGSGAGAAARDVGESTSVPPTTVVVHVAGAVVHAGVVSLPATARVVDAIDAAGGPRADADPDQLDLAAHLSDGSRIYVPRRGETVAASPGPSDPGAATSEQAAGPVHLNTATAAELEALPGIGPSLAASIISERERLGGFRRVDDLRRVRGIGDRRFEQLRTMVAL